MFKLFRRRRRWKVASRVRSRSETVHAASASLDDLEELAPRPEDLVARYAQVQLGLFEFLSKDIDEIEETDALARCSAVAGVFYDRFEGLRASLPDMVRVDSPDTALLRAEIGEFWSRLRPTLWEQRLLTGLLVSGMCDDAVDILTRSIKGPARSRLRSLASGHEVDEPIAALLGERVARDAGLRDMLSMWGRRLVGDTMLLVRGFLALPPDVKAALASSDPPADETVTRSLAAVETFRSELLAVHTRRMEALGLAS